MSTSPLLLISLKSKYWNNIRLGKKHYEYRRKFIPSACEAYIYVSGNDNALCRHIVAKIRFNPPIRKPIDEIAQIAESDQRGKGNGIKEYLSGLEMGYAVPIEEITEIEPIALSLIREYIPGFHPPQSYMFLDRNVVLLDIIRKYS